MRERGRPGPKTAPTETTPQTAALAGLRVLVTRPGAAGESLARRIEQHGGEAVLFPVIDIEPPVDETRLRNALRDLADADRAAPDLAIFVSVHAAHAVAARLKALGLKIPAAAQVAAVGPKTAAACAAAGIRVDAGPAARIDSEGLLDALRTVDLTGNRALIFRGQAGREALARGLRARGASVRHVAAYRRRITARPVAPLVERWRGGGIDAILVSSAAVWDALRELLGGVPGGRDLPAATPVFAYSRRVAAHCRARGAATVTAAAQPLDESALDALIAWARA